MPIANECPNPAARVSVANLVAQNSGTTGTVTRERAADGAVPAAVTSGFAFRVGGTGMAAGATVGYQFDVAATQGDFAHGSVYARADAALAGGLSRLSLAWIVAGSATGTVTTTTSLATFTRLSQALGVAPLNTTHVRITIQAFGPTTTAAFYSRFSGILLNVKRLAPGLLTYVDGSKAGHEWTGLADLSSSRTTPVLTPVYDAGYDRVGITVTGLAEDEDRDVYRVGEDGIRHAVRGANPANVSDGSAFSYDYEFYPDAPFHYEVDDPGVRSSAPLTVVGTGPVVRSPYLPTLNRKAKLTAKPERSRARPLQRIPILESRYPVVRAGTLQAESGTMTFYTKTDQEADDLESLLQQSVLQVYIPKTRFGTQYIALGDVNPKDATSYADGSASSKYTWWEVQYQVVDRPVGPTFGDPNATWAAVLARHATWAEVKAAYPNWLTLLRGVVE